MSVETTRLWARTHRDRCRAAVRRWYKKQGRHQLLMRTYGISEQAWEAMFEAQGRRCAICRLELQTGNKRSRSAHTDHDHTTGCVRGILCFGCNQKLAWLEKYDDAAHQYLGGHDAA